MLMIRLRLGWATYALMIGMAALVVAGHGGNAIGQDEPTEVPALVFPSLDISSIEPWKLRIALKNGGDRVLDAETVVVAKVPSSKNVQVEQVAEGDDFKLLKGLSFPEKSQKAGTYEIQVTGGIKGEDNTLERPFRLIKYVQFDDAGKLIPLPAADEPSRQPGSAADQPSRLPMPVVSPNPGSSPIPVQPGQQPGTGEVIVNPPNEGDVRTNGPGTPPRTRTKRPNSTIGLTKPAIQRPDTIASDDLGLKQFVLDKADEQIKARRFPYFDHRAHETADEFSKVLLAAAKKAAANKKDNDPLDQNTVALRNEVHNQVQTILKQRTGRTRDWAWLLQTAENYINEKVNTSLQAGKGDEKQVFPNPTRWGQLALVYQELGEAASELAAKLKDQRDVEDDLMARNLANGGTLGTGDGGVWVNNAGFGTGGSTKRRSRCWFLAP